VSFACILLAQSEISRKRRIKTNDLQRHLGGLNYALEGCMLKDSLQYFDNHICLKQPVIVTAKRHFAGKVEHKHDQSSDYQCSDRSKDDSFLDDSLQKLAELRVGRSEGRLGLKKPDKDIEQFRMAHQRLHSETVRFNDQTAL
jgi:hypothetical protein